MSSRCLCTSARRILFIDWKFNKLFNHGERDVGICSAHRNQPGKYQRVREDDFGRVFEGAAFSWGRRRSSVRAITKELLMIEQDTIKQALS